MLPKGPFKENVFSRVLLSNYCDHVKRWMMEEKYKYM